MALPPLNILGEIPKTAPVVESALAHRIALRGMLLNAGFTRVLQSDDEEDGLSALSAEFVHFVFASLEPRQPAARNILAFLRKKGRHRQIPVVMLDGGLRRQTRVAAVKAGIGGILPLLVKA